MENPIELSMGFLILIGICVIIFQLIRLHSWLERPKRNSIGGILLIHAIYLILWVVILLLYWIGRELEIISAAARDHVILFLLIYLVLAIWTFVYRLHRWWMSARAEWNRTRR